MIGFKISCETRTREIIKCLLRNGATEQMLQSKFKEEHQKYLNI